MVVVLSVDISKAEAKLKRIMKQAQTLPWNTAGNILLHSIDQNFQVGGRYSKEGSFVGGSRKWVKTKRRNRILVKTGTLKNRIKKIVRADGVTIKSTQVYSAAQQFGYEPNDLPARPFIVHQKKDLEDIGKAFIAHLSDV